MKTARINNVELAYELTGAGDPLLLIHPLLANGYAPLVAEPAFARYRVITYHRRGWAGSGRTPGPVSVAEHAADAAALLDHLDIPRAHVGGHSSAAPIVLQLALDRPDRVGSLLLLEPTFLSVPSAPAVLAKAGPALDAYAAGRHEEAVTTFLGAVSGLGGPRCRALLDERGLFAQAVRDADTFFGVELPSLGAWAFAPQQAATIAQPALSVLGSDTEPMWVEIDELLRSSMPRVETCKVDGVGHLLHLQRPEPVARGIGAFLARHPILASRR